MKRPFKANRPRHATVVAYLALFVALGGSAYAATQLPKNSVGTKQLKNGAVTGTKIKKGAVTAASIAPGAIPPPAINPATLGTVPNAAHASSADQANTATNAANAANAAELGGSPASDFASASVTVTGHAKFATSNTFLTGPGGWTLTTVAGGARVVLSTPEDGDAWSIGGPGGEADGGSVSENFELENDTNTLYARDLTTGQEWSVVCMRDYGEAETACTAVGH